MKGMDVNMKVDEFIINNEIAIFVNVDLKNRRFDIRKMDIELESYDLFEQLVLYSNIETLKNNIAGQIMPRIWAQGNTKCIMSKPNEEQIIVIFYDKCLDAKDNYFYAKQIDMQLKELFCHVGEHNSSKTQGA